MALVRLLQTQHRAARRRELGRGGDGEVQGIDITGCARCLLAASNMPGVSRITGAWGYILAVTPTWEQVA